MPLKTINPNAIKDEYVINILKHINEMSLKKVDRIYRQNMRHALADNNRTTLNNELNNLNKIKKPIKSIRKRINTIKDILDYTIPYIHEYRDKKKYWLVIDAAYSNQTSNESFIIKMSIDSCNTSKSLSKIHTYVFPYELDQLHDISYEEEQHNTVSVNTYADITIAKESLSKFIKNPIYMSEFKQNATPNNCPLIHQDICQNDYECVCFLSLLTKLLKTIDMTSKI